MDDLNNSEKNLTSPSIDIDTPEYLNALKGISLALLSIGTAILTILFIFCIVLLIGAKAFVDSISSSLVSILMFFPFLIFWGGSYIIIKPIGLYLALSILLLISTSTWKSITFKIVTLIISCLAIIYDIIFLSSMYQISALLLCIFVFILFHIIPTIYLFLFLKHHFKNKSKQDVESIKKF